MNSVSSLGFKYIVIDLEHSNNVANFPNLLSFLSNSHTKFSLCSNAQDVLERISPQNSLDVTKNMQSSSEAKPAQFEPSAHSTPKTSVSSSESTRTETVFVQPDLVINDASRKKQIEESVPPVHDQSDNNTSKQQTEPESLYDNELQEDLSNRSSLNLTSHDQNYPDPSDFEIVNDNDETVSDSNRSEIEKTTLQDNLEETGGSSMGRVQSAERSDGTDSVTHEDFSDFYQQVPVNNIERSVTVEKSNPSTPTISSGTMQTLKGYQTTAPTVEHHQQCDVTNTTMSIPQNSEIDPNVIVTHLPKSIDIVDADCLSLVENQALLEKRSSELTPRTETFHPKDMNTTVGPESITETPLETNIQKAVASTMDLNKSAFHPVQKQPPIHNFSVPFHGNPMFNEFQLFTMPHQLFPVPQQTPTGHSNIAVRVADFTQQLPPSSVCAQTDQTMRGLQAVEQLKIQHHQQRMTESMMQAERERFFRQQMHIYHLEKQQLNRDQLHVLEMVTHENIHHADIQAMLHQVQMPHSVVKHRLFELRFVAEQNRLQYLGITKNDAPGVYNVLPNQTIHGQQNLPRQPPPPAAQQLPIQLSEMHQPLNPNDPRVQAMMAQRSLENQNQQQNRQTRAIRARPRANEQFHQNAQDVQKNRQTRPDNRGLNSSEQTPPMPSDAHQARFLNLEIEERSQQISRRLEHNDPSQERMMAQKRRSQAQNPQQSQLNAEQRNDYAALHNQESQSSISSVAAVPNNHFQQSLQQGMKTRANPAGIKRKRGRQQHEHSNEASNNLLDIQPLSPCKNKPFEPSLQPYFKDSVAFENDRRKAEKAGQVPKHLHPFLRVEQPKNPGNLHLPPINLPVPEKQSIQNSQPTRSIQSREDQSVGSFHPSNWQLSSQEKARSCEVVPRNQPGEPRHSGSTSFSKRLQDPHQIAHHVPSQFEPSISKEVGPQNHMIEHVHNAEQLPVEQMEQVEQPEAIQKKMDEMNSDRIERNARIQFDPNSHYRIDTSPNQLEPPNKSMEGSSLVSIENEGWGEKRLKDFQYNFDKNYKARRSQENLLKKSQKTPETKSSDFNSLEPEFCEHLHTLHPKDNLKDSESAAKEGIILPSASNTKNQVDAVSEVEKKKPNVEHNAVDRNVERIVIRNLAETQPVTTQISCQSVVPSEKSEENRRSSKRVQKSKTSHSKMQAEKEFETIIISDSEGEEDYNLRYPSWSEKKLLEDVGLIEENAEVEPQISAETIKESFPKDPENERHQRLLKRSLTSSSELLKDVEKSATETDSPLDSPSTQPQRAKRVKKDEVVQPDHSEDVDIPSTFDQAAIELYDEGVLKKEFSRNRFPTEYEITCILAELKSKKCAKQVKKWFTDRRTQLGMKPRKVRRRVDE